MAIISSSTSRITSSPFRAWNRRKHRRLRWSRLVHGRWLRPGVHLDLIGSIKISLGKATEALGKKPTPELLDKVLAEYFPKFTLDADLRPMILKGQPLDRNLHYRIYVNVFARMISRQTGVYWGTSGHTPEPITVGALGPGAQNFRGYMDNTDVGKALHRLVNAP